MAVGLGAAVGVASVKMMRMMMKMMMMKVKMVNEVRRTRLNTKWSTVILVTAMANVASTSWPPYSASHSFKIPLPSGKGRGATSSNGLDLPWPLKW